MNNDRMPTYFLSHGGGPWPWVDQMRAVFTELEEFLRNLPAELPRRPEAILVISGHWEEDAFAVMSNPAPPMEYDFGGFPAHTYRVRYGAPGSPELAAKVQQLLANSGLPARLDPARGFDHGTYSMLFPVYPRADVPVVQLSVRNDYDPAAHLQAGRALSSLRDQGVLITGSGNTFHNFRPAPDSAHQSYLFERWLEETLTGATGDERAGKLERWSTAPSARACQPQEDHFIPLLVAAGAAHDDRARLANRYQMGMFGGAFSSSFRFG